jgi:Replication-relaxation
MGTPVHTLKGTEKILFALSVYCYLTAEQLTRLLYASSSLSFVRKLLKALVAAHLVLELPGRIITLPHVYTPTSTGYSYLAQLGVTDTRRVRPAVEREKARNLLFLQHTLAVNDVLIAAQLLSQSHPNIILTRMYMERELKRKIYVATPERTLIEPDASCEFSMTETWHETPQTWDDFFHIEVYRHVPQEGRFKQKIRGYVVSVETGHHEALFHTPALSIAVFAATEPMAAILKKWTQEALQESNQPEQGERFFFTSSDPATASPEEIFLSPVWEQALSTTKTPLLVLE